MDFLKPILATLMVLFCISCAGTSKNVDWGSPDYQEGLKTGTEMAKKDRTGIVCSSKSRFQATKAAKKQTNLLREQGKSETFLSGFYRGYKDTYEVFVDERCSD